jgi:thiamine-phosphate pyrophosphorylase
MTDERFGERLLPSIAALPRGSGIIFRHYSLDPSARRALFEQVRRVALSKRHWLIIAGDATIARGSHFDGFHGRRQSTRFQTAPVHSVREAIAAQRAGADLLFVSPIFATRSHLGARALGRVRFGLLTRGLKTPIIALGGMTKSRTRSLKILGIYGWAAIDALIA